MMRQSDGDGPEQRTICPACNALYDSSVLVCTRCGTGLLEIPDAPLLSGTCLDQRYDIEGVVGTGGMGTVYRARQRGVEREVAVKVLHPRFTHDPRAVKRFFREAQAMSRLVHPNIVTVFDFGRSSEGQLYMVMELLEGMTLGDLIHYRAPLAPPLALAIIRQVADALAHAHARRVVHRDLKPDNILVSVSEEGIWAKVVDFGIARLTRDPEDERGADHPAASTVDIAGTPAYMSPEQILGKEPDPRSDLYALGIILFELLTRRRPFDDPNSVTLCMKQLSEVPPRVGSLQAVSEPVERLVAALLAKEPEGRPARAEELVELIARCPESAFSYNIPKLSLAGGVEAESLATKATRAELEPVVAPTVAPTVEVMPRGEGLGRLARGDGRGEVESGGWREAPYVRGGRAVADVGAERAPVVQVGTPVAVALVATEHPTALKSGAFAQWVGRVRREGLEGIPAEAFEITREEQRVIVVVRVHGRARVASEVAVRVLGAALVALQAEALAANLGLRVGLVGVASAADFAEALDLARRLAVATTHGQVAVPEELATRVGLAVRPQTSVFLRDGSSLGCAVLRGETGGREAERAAGGAARPADGEEPEEAAGLLWGRGLPLRRLGLLGDESARSGPVQAVLVGGRGMGKTAILQAFFNGRRVIAVRASPLSRRAPAAAVMALVARALGLGPVRGLARDLDNLDVSGLTDRERALIELLLLDRAVVSPPTLKAWASLVVRLLTRAAEQGPLVIAVDDAHFLDAASAAILAQVVQLATAERRPWCFVGAARTELTGPFLADATRIELRPLGLRSMNQFAESLRIAPRQRHALLAAAGGNPATLALLARWVGDGEVPSEVQRLGEGALPWLLTELLRGADPRQAERAWLAAALGEGVEDGWTQAARLHLEKELPAAMARWLSDRLTRLGPEAARLAPAEEREVGAQAEGAVERLTRLGLFELAAAALDARPGCTTPEGRGAKDLEIAALLAAAGDMQGATARFDAAARVGGDRRPTALLGCARALLAVGDGERAAHALDLAEEAIGRGAKTREAGDWWVLKARAALVRGDLAGGQAALEVAQREAQALARQDARAARTLTALAQEAWAEVALARGDAIAAHTSLRQARDLFRDLGNESDSLRCLVALGELELDSGDVRRGGDTFRVGVRLAAEAGLVREELLAEIGLAETELSGGELDQGSSRLRGVLRRLQAPGSDETLIARAALGMAHAMRLRGLWAEVIRHAERAQALSTRPAVLTRAYLVEAEARLALGEVRRAGKVLDLAVQAAHRASHALLIARAGALREAVAAQESSGA